MLPLGFPSVVATVQPLQWQDPGSTKDQRLPQDQRAVNAGCSSLLASLSCSCPPFTVVLDRPSILTSKWTPTTMLLWRNGCTLHYQPSTCALNGPSRKWSDPLLKSISFIVQVRKQIIHQPWYQYIGRNIVQREVMRNEALGVIEHALYGEPVT